MGNQSVKLSLKALERILFITTQQVHEQNKIRKKIDKASSLFYFSLLRERVNKEKTTPIFKCKLAEELESIWKGLIDDEKKATFSCKILLHTIEAYLSQNYLAFDAHTGTNCCHGISVLIQTLIQQTSRESLLEVKTKIENELEEMKNGAPHTIPFWIPSNLIILASLYTLNYIREIDADKKIKTVPRKLTEVSPVTTAFFSDLTKALRLTVANATAEKFQLYHQMLPADMNINGTPMKHWGSYISEEHIRTNSRGLKYAPYVYTEQVILGHLIHTRSKVAVVNDIIDSSGQFIDRLIYVFQGDGVSKLNLLSVEELNDNSDEPIVVFGGYCYAEKEGVEALKAEMNDWLEHIPRLMLCGALNYPQFPRVSDDTNFDNSPIAPQEKALHDLFVAHADIEGVSSANPSLYCLAHIYVVSTQHMKEAIIKNEESSLPVFHSFHAAVNFTCPKMWGLATS